ncbi:hypothetical protein QE152_g8988 [Popillia japonica]|uniref:Uncharacterized protein n=1 Tax=Popillia japonica TaxID=7064 RepID=A0AAW1M1M8_POPJA
MDPKRYYGPDSRNIVPMDIPDAHDQSDVIIPESDLEVSNSDRDDDNIYSAEIRRSVNKNKNKDHPTGESGNLVISDNYVKFLISVDLPPELKDADSS